MCWRESLKNIYVLIGEMRHCSVCRRRTALQEVAFEQSIMFLCNVCFSRIEMEHAAFEEFEDEEEMPDPHLMDFLSFPNHKRRF